MNISTKFGFNWSYCFGEDPNWGLYSEDDVTDDQHKMMTRPFRPGDLIKKDENPMNVSCNTFFFK